jgi:hypothetical protein
MGNKSVSHQALKVAYTPMINAKVCHPSFGTNFLLILLSFSLLAGTKAFEKQTLVFSMEKREARKSIGL